MESTGKYWIPVYNVLESSCKVTFAHPKYVKAIRGKKTDKKYSIWIADLFKHDLVPGSFIPEKLIRDLREVLRYRSKIVSVRSSEKNRLQNSPQFQIFNLHPSYPIPLANPLKQSFRICWNILVTPSLISCLFYMARCEKTKSRLLWLLMVKFLQYKPVRLRFV